MLGEPARIVAQGVAQVIVHAVRLDVRFRIHVETQAVAQLVEEPRKRIVTCADGVDIVAFHQGKILEHQLPGDVVSCVLVMLVHVHTLELHRLAVDEQDSVLRPVFSRPVSDLETAEPHIEPCVLPVHAHQERIKLRGLGRPLPCSGHCPYELLFPGHLPVSLQHGGPVPVQKLVREVYCLLRVGTHLEPEDPVFQPLVKSGHDLEVKIRVSLLAGQVHIPLYPADPPEIVTFQIRPCAPSVYLEHQVVAAWPQGRGDVIPRQVLCIFVISCESAVDIYIHP